MGDIAAGEAPAAEPGPERNCLNCGAELTGRYCPHCGQKAEVHRTLRAFGHDLVHGAFHFEGRIWQTLPLLAWKPGELTRRYIEGQRARFVSPLATFLFSVFLMFAVFSTVGTPFTSGAELNEIETAQQLRREVEQLDRRIAETERDRAAAAAAGSATAELDSRLDELRAEKGTAETAYRITTGGGTAEGEMQANTGWRVIDKMIDKAGKNPSLLAYKVQANAYKFSWLLIPISIPFVALLFLWRRRFRLFDHAVFVTYSLAAMTLLVVALSLIRGVVGAGDLIGLALVLLPPIHIYRQLKGAYSLRRFSALWRTGAIMIFANIALLIFFLLLLLLGTSA